MPVLSRPIVKKALLVGVKYTTSDDSLKKHGLAEQPGTHKDTFGLRHFLIAKYGYRAQDITILVDDDRLPEELWPTRNNIMTKIDELTAGTESGDHIVFSFSGHGGQVQASIDKNEIDGLDEILLPVDTSIGLKSEFINYIKDDEIRERLVDRLPDGVQCVMVFDCCHSGTASDLPCVDECLISPVSPITSPILQGPRAPRAFAQMDTLHDGHADNMSCQPPSELNPSDKEVTSWSACLDSQLTYGGKSGGMFMKAFVRVLSEDLHPTNAQLLRSLRKALKDATERQNKLLSTRGTADLLVPPRPQVGSLKPKTILYSKFSL